MPTLSGRAVPGTSFPTTSSEQWVDDSAHWIEDLLNQTLAVLALTTMRTGLQMTDADLATMLWNQSGLEINDSMIRGWRSRISDVPEELIYLLLEDEQHCLTILHLYRPDRVPDIIRRDAPIFNNNSALSLILAGGISEVAEAYDTVLHFQG